MKSFRNYLQIREEKIPTLGEDDSKNNRLFKIMKLAWKSHRDSTISFIRSLSKIDPEIATEFEDMKYASDDEIDSGPVKKHKNYDMLVPPVSDVSGGDGDNGPD
jgi:hypothetical protein